jgi:nickel/cobalt exporter
MLPAMGPLTELLQPGAAASWLLPSALVLGVLHGLEPGHSKTMMTAFIITVRGSVVQAVLLGFAATVSHTSVVWVVALIGMHFGSRYNGAVAEPYFQMASAVLIIAIALWMLRGPGASNCGCAAQRVSPRIIMTTATITHTRTPTS